MAAANGRALMVLVLCSLLVLQSAACFFHAKAAQSRKMLQQADLKKSNEEGKGTTENREKIVGWELRTVPSGPDPLHHNGGSPKKPRVDP